MHPGLARFHMQRFLAVAVMPLRVTIVVMRSEAVVMFGMDVPGVVMGVQCPAQCQSLAERDAGEDRGDAMHGVRV